MCPTREVVGMEKPQEGIDSGELYLHVNTLAGAFNLSDELLAWKFDRDYLERIAYSERNFDGKARDISPLPYSRDLQDLVRQINSALATPEFGNGIAVRVSWITAPRTCPPRPRSSGREGT